MQQLPFRPLARKVKEVSTAACVIPKRSTAMKSPRPDVTSVGELVEAAFAQATQYSADSQVVRDLATRAIAHLLRCARRFPQPSFTPRSTP
jgi:hypothetical protein